jgi:hypothetical protein
MGQRGKYSTIGSRIGIGDRGQIVKRQGASFLDLSRPCVDVTGTISAEGATVANQRNISLIFKDDEGDPIAYAEVVELMVFASSAMLAFSAGGSTGIAAGANGNIVTVTAKQIFRGITTAAGLLDVIYTDTATAAAYLAARLPNGRVVGIGVLTNT